MRSYLRSYLHAITPPPINPRSVNRNVLNAKASPISQPHTQISAHATNPAQIIARGSYDVPGRRFELLKAMPADLQSAPFGRSGNLACTIWCGYLPYYRHPMNLQISTTIGVSAVECATYPWIHPRLECPRKTTGASCQQPMQQTAGSRCC